MLRHGFQYFIVRTGNGLLAVATIAIFTRLLTPKAYGLYSLGIAATTIMSAVLFQWLNVSVGRFYPKYHKQPEIVIAAAKHSYWTIVAIASVLFIVVILFHRWIGLEYSLVFLLFLITVVQGRYDLSLQVANAQGSPLRYGLMAWTKTGICLLVGFFFIMRGSEELGALLGFLLGLLVAVMAFHPFRVSKSFHRSEHNLHSVELLRYGLPLSITFLAIVIVDLADRVLIGWMLGSEHVAPYAATYDLVQQSIGSIMNIFLLSAFPAVVRTLENDGVDTARARLKGLAQAYIAVGLAATVGLASISGDIVATILGKEIRQGAYQIIPWLAASIFIGAYKSYYLDLSFQLSRSVKYQAYIAVLMACVNIVLNIFLLPSFGILGAAWATLASFSIGAIISWRIGMALFSLPSVWSDFFKTVFCSCVMAFALWTLPLSKGIAGLIFKIFFGGTVYVACALVLDIAGCREKVKSVFAHGYNCT